MPPGKKINTLYAACDKVRFFAFCIMIFFLPIASSFIEGAFGLIILTYIIERTTRFILNNIIPAWRSTNISFHVLKKGFLESYKPVATPLSKPIGIYMLVAFLTIFASYYPGETLKAFIFQLAQATFTFFLFVETVVTKKRLHIILGLLLASVSLISANGIFQYFARVEFIRNHPINDGRVTSSFGHANNLAAYLIVLLPLLFSMSKLQQWLVQGKRHHVHVEVSSMNQSSRLLIEWVCLIVFLLALICLGLTYSRGPILLFCLSLIAFVVHKPKRLLFVLLICALFGSFFFVKMYQERTTNISDPQEGRFGLAKRLVYWEEAWNMIKDHPVTGIGLNCYSNVGRLYRIGWGGYPHNGYLHIAAEVGLFGLMAFLWIWLRFFCYVKQAWRGIDDQFYKRLLLGLSIGLATFFVYALIDTNLHDDRLETIMWLAVGISVSLDRIIIQRS